MKPPSGENEMSLSLTLEWNRVPADCGAQLQG